MSGLRVAVAHDYLTQCGGAERVVLQFAQAFPDCRILTNVYNSDSTFPEFSSYAVSDTWLAKFAVFRRDPRLALPLLPRTTRSLTADDVDAVLCSSTGWAHGISARVPKIVYCHNPARWLYQADDYLREHGVAVRAGLRLISPSLRRWDHARAHEATRYIANSRLVASRIRATYGIEAAVVHPPRGVDVNGPMEPIDGIEPGYVLTVGRPRGYKHTDLIARAVAAMSGVRLVCVGGKPDDVTSPDVTGVTDVSDAQLRWLYANCVGLAACSYEDFGLTPVEAYAFGKPVAVLRWGGYLETTDETVSGVFIEDLSQSQIELGIDTMLRHDWDASAIRTHGEQWSPESFRSHIVAHVDAAVRGEELVEVGLPHQRGEMRPAAGAGAGAAAGAAGVGAGSAAGAGAAAAAARRVPSIVD